MIDLAVPETVTTPFVVATAQPPHDPGAVARAGVRQPLAADLLSTPLVQIRTLPAGESGYADLLGSAAWAGQEDRGLLHKLNHHVVVLGHIPPVSQPGHGQATREIARVIAEACDGIVYDAWSHQVLPHDFKYAAEHPEFCLADDWLATFVTGDRADDRASDRASGRAGDEGPDDAHDLRLMTAGLHRFGLPELEAQQVPARNVFAAVTLLRCLAVTLLSEHWDWLACNPGARSRRLDRHVWIEGRDIWRYWAAEPKSTAASRVRVRLDQTGQDDATGAPGRMPLPYVSVGPPADFMASTGEWWNDVVDLAMPYVAAAPRRMAA